MSTTPAPRPAGSTPPPAGTVIASMDGLGRRLAHGPVDVSLILTMVYRQDRPHDVNVVISRGRPLCGHDPARSVIEPGEECHGCDRDLVPWLVSREMLHGAATWQTPAGMGDFRATPMGDDTTQLVFIASDPEYRGEVLYVDVQRKSLLEFLDRTARLVRPGQESKHIDMDRLIAALLGSGVQ
jgi:sporulation and cell division protein SsgA